MMEPWRPLAVAAVLTVTLGAGVGTAQTVIVRSAPPGSTIELVLNAATIGTTTADAAGDARIGVTLSAAAGKTEMDAHVSVDVCGTLRRVLLVEGGLQPPAPGEGCDRREIPGLFVVRRVTTLVVDVGGTNPTLWLRQGAVPKEWLQQGEARAARTWRPLPTGIVVSGGGSFTRFSNARDLACGNAPECAGKAFRPTYTVGAAYWITRFLAAEASYVRPTDVTVTGRGFNYRFNGALDTRLFTIAGKAGVPVGPVRIYGQIGADYHQATSSTTETIDDTTVTTTLDNVTRTIAGGTQTFELKTEGWGWLFGGGVEAWVARRVAVYGEVGSAALKGSAPGGGDGGIDERLFFILFGARVHIGR